MIRGFVAAAIALAATVPTVAAPGRGDLGRFVVTAVLTDPALDNNEQRYFRDDPRLLGRLVEIAPARLAMDGSSPCTAVGRRWSRGTVAAVLRTDLSRRSPNHPPHPRPADMGLTGAQAGGQPTDVVRYACRTPDRGGGPVAGRAWDGVPGFPLGPGRRGMIWDGEVVLVLSPASRTAARPSFACSAAAGVSERTICSDPSLANWDRSVATAYRLMRDGGGPDEIAPVDDRTALAQSQRAWTGRRDACGADRACLAGRMQERTEQLMRREF